MKNRIILLLSVILTTMISCRTQSVKEVDICIYGGTSAGVIAAYTAQQSGKSVLLHRTWPPFRRHEFGRIRIY